MGITLNGTYKGFELCMRVECVRPSYRSLEDNRNYFHKKLENCNETETITEAGERRIFFFKFRSGWAGGGGGGGGRRKDSKQRRERLI